MCRAISRAALALALGLGLAAALQPAIAGAATGDSLALAFPAPVPDGTQFAITLTGRTSVKNARIYVVDASVPCHDALENPNDRALDFNVQLRRKGAFDRVQQDTYTPGPPFFVCGFLLAGRHLKVLAHASYELTPVLGGYAAAPASYDG